MHLLGPLRDEIDAVDDRIIELLGVRLGIVRRVAAIKEANGIPVVLADRIREVKERNAARGVAEGLDPDFVRHIYQVIIDEACDLERRVTDRGDTDASGIAGTQTTNT